jgi:hypothetical protein
MRQPQLEPGICPRVGVGEVLRRTFTHLLQTGRRHRRTISTIHGRHDTKHVSPKADFFECRLADVIVCTMAEIPIAVNIEAAVVAKEMVHGDHVRALVRGQVQVRPFPRVGEPPLSTALHVETLKTDTARLQQHIVDAEYSLESLHPPPFSLRLALAVNCNAGLPLGQVSRLSLPSRRPMCTTILATKLVVRNVLLLNLPTPKIVPRPLCRLIGGGVEFSSDRWLSLKSGL